MDTLCENSLLKASNFPHLKREFLFKYVVIGEYGVGKTSIIKRYAEDSFSSTYKITIGADFALKTIEWDNKTMINLQLWDISGYERFGTLTNVYYRYALAAAVVFDLTRPETFPATEKWILNLRERVTLPNGDSIPIILLANKGDVALENVPPDIEQFCKKNNIMMWLVTSAKENINLDVAMNTLIKHTLEHTTYIKNNIEQPITLQLEEKKTKSKRYCFF